MNTIKSLSFLLPLCILLSSLNSGNNVKITVKTGANEINYSARYNLVLRDGTISFEAKNGKTSLFIGGVNITYYSQEKIKGTLKLKKEEMIPLPNKNTKGGPYLIKVKELPAFKNKIAQFDIVINKIHKNSKDTKNEIPFTKRTYSFKYK